MSSKYRKVSLTWRLNLPKEGIARILPCERISKKMTCRNSLPIWNRYRRCEGSKVLSPPDLIMQ
jgi:hypothetical protein